MVWVRDGTICSAGVTEIDLTNGKDWITIKGDTDANSEKLSELLLVALNSTDGDNP